MKKLQTNIIRGLCGRFSVPGDKSIAHRSVIFGSISHGVTEIDRFPAAEDCLTTIKAFQELGVSIHSSADQLQIKGVGIDGLKKPEQPLNMGNSGTTTRLLLGLLSGQPYSSSLYGDRSLSRRPMARMMIPLHNSGADFESHDDHLPITVHGHSGLQPIDYQMPVASAQVKSGLILAALQADGFSKITEKQQTRDHTERMLRAFGGKINIAGRTITLQGHQHLTARRLSIPGDMSSAAFFIAAATLVPGSCITLTNVGLNPTRTGFLRTLKKMGANLISRSNGETFEPAGTVVVRSSCLHAIRITESSIPDLIDELPLIALLATQAEGTTIISGAQELRVKETDRIHVVVEELAKLGAQITEQPDGMIISGPTPLHAAKAPCLLNSHGDHRIGMMLAVAALILKGAAILENEEAVKISYPDFFSDLDRFLHQETVVIQTDRAKEKFR